MLSSMPILFGRRFRKMQHRGPHAWLTRAVTIKNRTIAAASGLAHHILLFSHMVHSWANASKENAFRFVSNEAEQRQKLLAQEDMDGDERALQLEHLRQKVENEVLWGLGEKALRVVAQNIDSVPVPWTRDIYTANRDVKAAVGLGTAILYAYSGMAHTVFWTAEHNGMEGVQSGPTNTYLHRDLSRLWEAVAVPHFSKLFASEVDALHMTGYRTLHALLRAGEQGPEDTALARFNLDRLVNPNLLARHSSQIGSASSVDEDIDRLLADGIGPAELPAFKASWVLARRKVVYAAFEEAFISMRNVTKETVESQRSSAGTPNALTTASGWLKNEDGYAVMPIALSTAVRAYFTTLRTAAEADCQINLADLASEVARFAVDLAAKAAVPAYMRTDLGQTGSHCAILQHLIQLLEQTFGLSTEGKATAAAGKLDVSVLFDCKMMTQMQMFWREQHLKSLHCARPQPSL